MKNLSLKNIGRIIVGYLNINSIRNKFEALKEIVGQNIDILMIAETKIDPSFPKEQFFFEGYAEPLRLDRNANGGGLLVYVRSNIPTTELKSFKFDDDIECICFEINLRGKKWAIFSIYRPPSQSQDHFIENLGKAVDYYSENYDNFLVVGDFNTVESDQMVHNFMNGYALKNLVKEPTCFKSDNPRCIDLILTNKHRSFQNTTTIATGLSDFHKMVLTVLKTTYRKSGPTVIHYRDYKQFSGDTFKQHLGEELQKIQSIDLNYDSFQTCFDKVLDQHAPVKKKYARANDGPFMNRTLRKAIMIRSRLKNKYYKNRTVENWEAFRKQRNLCVKLFKTEKRNFYRNLDISQVTDNKLFWKTVKPFISDKNKGNSKITLIEDDKIVSKDKEVAETLNNYFVTITDSLGLTENSDVITNTEDLTDPIDKAITKYSNHPSIRNIRNFAHNENTFHFDKVSVEDMKIEISKLNPKKATTYKNIPPKILKATFDICADPLTTIFNDGVQEFLFPDQLKSADVTALHKSGVKTSKTNYRPVSVLPTVSKIFERIMDRQMIEYITPHLSVLLCGFRKGFNTQHALIRMLEKWKVSLDNGETVGAILMDLSKAFDCIKHDLLLAKLDAYGFSREALSLINSFLENRQQRVKINGSFSSFKQLNLGVPQGSVLGPLLFNIYINDLLFSIEQTDICNYADDSTIYACDKNLENVVWRLENDSNTIIQWFANNFMKLNTDKCHLLMLGKGSNGTVTVNIGNSTIENSGEEKLLGVTIDDKLTFEVHITKLCKKAGNKLFALSRMSPYMDSSKLRVLLRSFVISQFQYCPLVWMFHSRQLNNKINRIHERALRIAHKDYESTFEVLLSRDQSVTVHTKNLQTLMTEIFKTQNNLNPPFMNEVFRQRENIFNLRNGNQFVLPRIRTVKFGSETISYRGAQLWQRLPHEIRNVESLLQFKSKIKEWSAEECVCRLCQNFVPNLGFL